MARSHSPDAIINWLLTRPTPGVPEIQLGDIERDEDLYLTVIGPERLGHIRSTLTASLMNNAISVAVEAKTHASIPEIHAAPAPTIRRNRVV